MRLYNESRYPDAEVRALVAFAMRGADTAGVAVKVKNIVADHGGHVGGAAYHGVPDLSPLSRLRTIRKLVTLRVAPPERFPGDNLGFGRDGGPYGGKRSPVIVYGDWREGLVAVAAHEARHVWQDANGKRASEVDAERFAARRLDAYRAALAAGAVFA